MPVVLGGGTIMRTAMATWLLILLAPAPGLAQASHEDHVEVIRPPSVKPAPDPKKPDVAAAAKSIIEQTNVFRKDEGKSLLKVDERLSQTARYFAGYMASSDRYGHTADGSSPA